MKKEKEYAIYKGDEFLYLGTLKECAAYLEVSERTIKFYMSKAYQKRSKTKENKRLLVVEIK